MNNLALKSTNCLFIPAFREYSWPDLLTYYQYKPATDFFPLSAGKPKYVLKADEILNNCFRLNNEFYQLPDDFDWRCNPSADLEWLILLHKSYYLKDLAYAYDHTENEKYAQKWVGLIDSWIHQEVPEGFINSQVTGRRLQQWLISFRYFVGKWKSSSILPAFFARFIQSVNAQAHYLCQNLTPEGNHRTLELYAIFVVAVTFPELASACYFLQFAIKNLLENIQQDLLPDGVHRELSTDYHHTVLKNYLRFRALANLNNIPLPEVADELLQKALVFSCYAHKPDGFIPAINDGDNNSYLPLLEKAYALYGDERIRYVITQGESGLAPTPRSRLFASSGYSILRSDWSHRPFADSHYLFFDCAKLGFGSHGHYDALSFEAAAYGQSLIVDPGRYTYCETGHEDNINWRKYFKGTAAHNTVGIDGLDQIVYQCECPIDPEPETQVDFFISHQGFDWVQGSVISQRYPVTHERSIFFLPGEYWIATDRLLTSSLHDYDLYFHLSERAQDRVEVAGDETCYSIISPNLVISQPRQADIRLTIEQGYVSPEYGVKHPAPVARFTRQQCASATFHTVLYPYKATAPKLKTTMLPVNCEGSMVNLDEASLLTIKLNGEHGNFEDMFFINHLADCRRYNFGNFIFSGKMLFIRCDAEGRIVNLQAEAVETLIGAGVDVFAGLGAGIRVSFHDGSFLLTATQINHTIKLSGLNAFPDWNDILQLWRAS